jgi:ATP-dependent Lhr-like helicase
LKGTEEDGTGSETDDGQLIATDFSTFECGSENVLIRTADNGVGLTETGMKSTTMGRQGTDQVLSLLHPIVSEWFRAKYDSVTEAQSKAVPLIHSGESVLVSSPTGSGKTLTAFLSIINELILLAGKGELEDRIYAVYVSPLKALANDINANLLIPLEEISRAFESRGLEAPGIRVAVRTGDTLPSERQKQARTPPHIFITTPESLSLVLSTPVFGKRFEAVDYVIVDEVHEVCDSKRGVALSVALERLQHLCKGELVRIGLSATVAPVEQVAEFLAGRDGHGPRPMKIVEVFGQRDLDLSVICPADDMTTLSFEVVNSKMYDTLKEMIDEHRTTLVFTNTRSGTESVVYKLKERGLEQIGAHHGSLSRETRLEVEDYLRAGDLRAVVSSTSLELGIDIGSIDLVVQIGSPKSVAKGLQRVGRAGHQYGGTSKGRMIVFENDDLIECAVLSRAAHRKAIDRVTIPMNSLDVLAQVLVGLSLERPWGVDEALDLLTRSYCYKDLTIEQLESVLEYIGGTREFEGVYSKVWYDEQKRMFGRKRGSRMIFYLNQGTIPEEADYRVFTERGAPVGSLSEKFVERLSRGDIFVLGGRSYEFVRSKGMKAMVKSATGRKPTVPSWTGEMLPRSFDLSVMVGQFRDEMDSRLEGGDDAGTRAWLMEDFHVDEGSANTIINYFREQRTVATIPTNSRLVVEGYIDQSGNRNAVFHFPFGRRVNDALSRAYAGALSERTKANVTISISDDCFMLTVPKPFTLEGLTSYVSTDTLERRLRESIKDSELFMQRFRHVATRSFMVLRNYKGKELSVGRQQLRSQRLLDALHELSDFPVISETYNEILDEVMDLERAKEVLTSIERGEREVEYIPFSSVPSPFAHNIVLIGVSDIVLMEDKSLLLRNLHRRVVERVLGEDASSAYRFDPDEVEAYFGGKRPPIGSKDDIEAALRAMGPLSLFKEKGESVYRSQSHPFETVRGWALEVLREGKARSVWIGEDVYVHAEDHRMYSAVHTRPLELNSLDRRILRLLRKRAMTAASIAGQLGVAEQALRPRLKRLEMANHIHRSDLTPKGPAFLASDAKGVDRSAAVTQAILRHVEFHAPISVEDLAYEVGVPEEEARRHLDALVSKGTAVVGRFVVGDNVQYMLSRDYLRLTSGGERVFDREDVRAYVEAKQFAPLDSVESYFRKFGSAGMAYDLFHRVRNFDMEEFFDLRRSGTLLLGRMVRGRVRYALADDVPAYLSVFREGRLNKYESAILSTVEKMETGTYQDIAEKAGLPPSIMREQFDSLDRKGFLLREFDEAEYWSSRNTYSVCRLEPDNERGYRVVLERLLRGHGPMPLPQVAMFLGVDEGRARAMLADSGVASIRVGLERFEMFLMKDEIAELESFVEQERPEPTLRILSLYDPFLSDRWAEISATYGEGWMYPVVRGGDMVGMIESWLMAGAVEVRDIRLAEATLLGQLVEALDRSMEFYNTLGVDILRVRSVFGTEVASLDEAVKSEFLSRGFEESNGMLVKGNLVTGWFDHEALLSVMLSCQNLTADSRLASTEEALARYRALRSDSETMIRVRRFTPLSELQKMGEVVRGYVVPERVGYCSGDEASMFRAARAKELTEAERLILRIVTDKRPLKRNKLLTLSPLGPEETVEAAKGLYRSSHLFLDSTLSYVPSKKRRITRESAWRAIISGMFEVYGVASAESLGMLLGRDMRMRDLRKVLRELVRRGTLVKGHLLSGSSTIYWATPEAYASLVEGRRFDESTVLSPEDNLYQFLKHSFRDLMPPSGRYAVLRGPRVVGSFEGKVRDGALEMGDIDGDASCRKIVEMYARMIGMRLRETRRADASDWEIMEFYEKSHPGAG